MSVHPAIAFDRRRVSEQLLRERVRVEEARELLERRRPFGLHEARVPDEADARLAALQRDEPDPVAPAREVVRGEAARRHDRAMERVGRVKARDLGVVHVLHAAVAHPDRGRRVRLDRRQRRRACARASPAGPSRPRPICSVTVTTRAVALLDDERVPGVAVQGDVDDLRGPPDLGSFFRGQPEHVLVQRRAVDLEGGRPGELRGAGLGRFPQARDLLVVEPVAEGLLGKLLARQVVPELQHARQEVGRDLDGRLAHLPVERRALLDDEDLRVRHSPPEEDRGRGARDRAADDDDVVVEMLHRDGVSIHGAEVTGSPTVSSTMSVRSTTGDAPEVLDEARRPREDEPLDRAWRGRARGGRSGSPVER